MEQSEHFKLQRDYIVQLFQQLTLTYADLNGEIAHIAKYYPVPENEFSFLEEFELVVVSISGYIKQVQELATTHNQQDAIAHLQKLQVFAIPTIAQFSLTTGDRYPNVKRYLQLLDYLRLLTVEYLQFQQTEQPILA